MRRQAIASYLLLASMLLSGCQSDAKVELPLVLTTVLPSPSTPGQAVTLYGRLPAGSKTVNLRNATTGKVTEVTGQPVKDGLTWQIPESLTADLYTVSIPGIEDQTVTLDVVPRLDSLSLNGTELVALGAGWSDIGSALVEVNNQRLQATGDTHTLRVTVNRVQSNVGTASDLYGVLNVRVLVAERASEMKSLSKAAVKVTGQLQRPASTTTSAVKAQSVRDNVVPSRRITWQGEVAAPLAGLQTEQLLPVMNLRRAVYRTAQDAAQALDVLKQQGIKAEFDQVIRIQDTLKEQISSAAITSLGVQSQWQWPLMGVTTAWQKTRGAGVTVAVVDTGVARDHPDLKNNLLPGWDFVDRDADPNDSNGHGTHVAGLIAANGTVRGVAPEAKVLPVRVIGPDGGTVTDLIQGMLYAAGLDPAKPNPHPAQVINMSLGTPEYSDLLRQAVQKILEAGVIVVAANGNDGGLPYAPANISGVIAVTSVNGPVTTYQPAYANRGPGTRIAAYGGDLNADQDNNGTRDGILSTDLDSAGKPTYALRQGTSMAAPEVSGLAALLLAQGHPSITVKSLLEGQATDLGVSGMDLTYGWGLANANPLDGTQDEYVVALNSEGQVITYVHPKGGQFTLQSLPPNQPVRFIAGTDRDHDGVVGEMGELLSPSTVITTQANQIGQLTLTLQPANGAATLTLPR